jgi:hypothetical protein
VRVSTRIKKRLSESWPWEEKPRRMPMGGYERPTHQTQLLVTDGHYVV